MLLPLRPPNQSVATMTETCHACATRIQLKPADMTLVMRSHGLETAVWLCPTCDFKNFIDVKMLTQGMLQAMCVTVKR